VTWHTLEGSSSNLEPKGHPHWLAVTAVSYGWSFLRKTYISQGVTHAISVWPGHQNWMKKIFPIYCQAQIYKFVRGDFVAVIYLGVWHVTLDNSFSISKPVCIHLQQSQK
jgi:hypothetical protein